MRRLGLSQSAAAQAAFLERRWWHRAAKLVQVGYKNVSFCRIGRVRFFYLELFFERSGQLVAFGRYSRSMRVSSSNNNQTFAASGFALASSCAKFWSPPAEVANPTLTSFHGNLLTTCYVSLR
jgi:hypothetical protein